MRTCKSFFSTTLAVAGILGVPAPARAGCDVILCLSNPAGWASVSECVSIVSPWLQSMARGKLPTCSYSNGATGRADARVAYVEDGGSFNADGDWVPRMVRVIQFKDPSGKTVNVRF